MMRLNVEDEVFIARARMTQKKCQVGTNNLDAAHDILAACYGTIGRLIALIEGAEAADSRTSSKP